MGHPDFVLHPLVAGPERVPKITDPAKAAANLGMAVLSVITHATDPRASDILNALLTAVQDGGSSTVGKYADLIRTSLPVKLWSHLEEHMQPQHTEFLSDYTRSKKAEGKAEGRAEGRAEGEAQTILKVLRTRGLDVPEDVRAEISECRDDEVLDAWVVSASTAESVEELLERRAHRK
ncbi:hypothetical protein GEV43_20770 [Actinomadura sp. J1-007]|nr:hypothetical protein [Actinomadura sp. J1-007]MWK36234.1 hypothetical protein [Actinomadura sp. J1-007]